MNDFPNEAALEAKLVLGFVETLIGLCGVPFVMLTPALSLQRRALSRSSLEAMRTRTRSSRTISRRRSTRHRMVARSQNGSDGSRYNSRPPAILVAIPSGQSVHWIWRARAESGVASNEARGCWMR